MSASGGRPADASHRLNGARETSAKVVSRSPKRLISPRESTYRVQVGQPAAGGIQRIARSRDLLLVSQQRLPGVQPFGLRNDGRMGDGSGCQGRRPPRSPQHDINQSLAIVAHLFYIDSLIRWQDDLVRVPRPGHHPGRVGGQAPRRQPPEHVAPRRRVHPSGWAGRLCVDSVPAGRRNPNGKLGLSLYQDGIN